ncbi:MAG TPA: co-chaperone GroES [Candidatus Saccharimonas sp.]|nr:co-chaperone GroES [Candidatus Saccharimonas sp.]
MQLHPLADRIVARQMEAESKTASGLLLPESAKEKPLLAEVLAVGAEVKEVKKGDKIVYKQYSATEFKMGSDEQFVIKEEDVLAVVKE